MQTKILLVPVDEFMALAILRKTFYGDGNTKNTYRKANAAGFNTYTVVCLLNVHVILKRKPSVALQERTKFCYQIQCECIDVPCLTKRHVSNVEGIIWRIVWRKGVRQ